MTRQCRFKAAVDRLRTVDTERLVSQLGRPPTLKAALPACRMFAPWLVLG
jgi:hypothetical protein